MRKLFVLLLLLALPVLSFAQYPWTYTSSGDAVSLTHSFVDTTAMKATNISLSEVVNLGGYVSTSPVGGGWFQVVVSSATKDAENIFAHPLSTRRYLRIHMWSGTDVFVTTAQVDTVLIPGSVATDKYFITGIGGSVDAQDVLQAEAKVDTLIVHRLASGASALEYMWIRVR